MADEINNQEVQPEFHIQRVYTKDVSFEAPNTPHIFQKEWQPDVKLDMDTQDHTIELTDCEGHYVTGAELTVDGGWIL